MSDTPITEFDFLLPRGLLDDQGQIHRQGVMRLATAKDELWVRKDPRSRNDSGYGDLIMLARVVTHLGTLSSITPERLENLFSVDLAYLREFYNRINQQGEATIPVQCPLCSGQFKVELALSGEF